MSDGVDARDCVPPDRPEGYYRRKAANWLERAAEHRALVISTGQFARIFDARDALTMARANLRART